MAISRIDRLFMLRNKMGMDQMDEADMPEYQSLMQYGEGLGVMPPRTPGMDTGATQQGQVSTMPDSSMQSDAAMPSESAPMRSGIPALDTLSEMPRRRSRGLIHNRKLGRVMPG